MEDNFNYWDPEHYEIKEVSGSEKLCIDAFNAEAKKYPPMLYGTHILLKEFNEEIREIVHNIDEKPLLSYKIMWNKNIPTSWAISSQIEVLNESR